MPLRPQHEVPWPPECPPPPQRAPWWVTQRLRGKETWLGRGRARLSRIWGPSKAQAVSEVMWSYRWVVSRGKAWTEGDKHEAGRVWVCASSQGRRWKCLRLVGWRVETEGNGKVTDRSGRLTPLTAGSSSAGHTHSFPSSPAHPSALWRQASPLLAPNPSWINQAAQPLSFRLSFADLSLISNTTLVTVAQTHILSVSADGISHGTSNYTSLPSSGKRGKRMIAGRGKSRSLKKKRKELTTWFWKLQEPTIFY